MQNGVFLYFLLFTPLTTPKVYDLCCVTRVSSASSLFSLYPLLFGATEIWLPSSQSCVCYSESHQISRLVAVQSFVLLSSLTLCKRLYLITLLLLSLVDQWSFFIMFPSFYLLIFFFDILVYLLIGAILNPLIIYKFYLAILLRENHLNKFINKKTGSKLPLLTDIPGYLKNIRRD